MTRIDRARRVIAKAALQAPTAEGRRAIERMRVFTHYAEPGYDTRGLIALGNWNTVTRWNEQARQFDTLDESPAKIGILLESKYAVSLEWEDEWSECSRCGGIFRISPDGHGWLPSYCTLDSEQFCVECMKKHKDLLIRYLQHLEGNEKTAMTLEIDLEDYGYLKLNDEPFERGLMGGQNGDPKAIAHRLRSCGHGRFVFSVDAAGQFDMRFSVWYPRDACHTPPNKRGVSRFSPALFARIKTWFNRPSVVASEGSNYGPDPALAMERGLRAASEISARLPEGGVKLVTIDTATGLASGRTLTPDEFAKGVPNG